MPMKLVFSCPLMTEEDGTPKAGELLQQGLERGLGHLLLRRTLDKLGFYAAQRLYSGYVAGEKAIVCDQCGAQFQKEDALEAHRQIHTAPHRSQSWTARACLTGACKELDMPLLTGASTGLDQYGARCKEGLNGANDHRGIPAESLAKYRTGVWSKKMGSETCPPARELNSSEASLPCGYQAYILNVL
ncbi:hypothetical protein MHYP_G00211280 [Metynnis hypsauchen]